MSPEQMIKSAILAQAIEQEAVSIAEPVTKENIDELYEASSGEYQLQDFEMEFREGQVETNIAPPSSRHYESKSVATQMADGSWIGWTYWYGGGKHAEPESIDWMSEAYALACVEEQKVMTVRTFSKSEARAA
ncbi:hypothetical protein [Rhodanobacter lindaniclasticus]|uniref:Uncharacterized protein n=1 Tax=Rhodanobacter lindaniclasticus TaxID=75310 RepID=A0A4S3KCI3_9GAMM|nr:hypothetical protein [Rhodanobacter lindaniclasticus]THD06153.1 hypothetical protein B1991_14515 [Rhodanobacter lindaniclasticus]